MDLLFAWRCRRCRFGCRSHSGVPRCSLQMGSHNLNKTSTRSHCIMTLQVKGRSREEDGKLGPLRHGRISLVDLAGD